MMNHKMYDHVLFKDLIDFVKRTDYFTGYTPTEKAWIRKNLDTVSKAELNDIIKNNISGINECEHSDLVNLINKNQLIPGTYYAMNNFLTIYLSNEIKNGRYVSYGLNTNPSKKYTILLLAYDNSTLSKKAIIIGDDVNSLLWTVEYDYKSELLNDGTSTLGKITYLKDENGNEASYDFKNIIGSNGYTFLKNGLENSKNCYNNNIKYASNIYFLDDSNDNYVKGSNIIFKYKINNLNGTLNNVIINDNLFSDSYPKQIIDTNTKHYILYFDKETLTNQLYAL